MNEKRFTVDEALQLYARWKKLKLLKKMAWRSHGHSNPTLVENLRSKSSIFICEFECSGSYLLGETEEG